MSVVQHLVETIGSLHSERRIAVAVDGPDGAGKTTLVRELARRSSRPVVLASVDDWHNPREVRLRRGPESPEGYYRDSFDYDALNRECIAPFRSGASRVRTAKFDHLADREVESAFEVTSNTVLLLDGVFLLRPELRGLWDLSIYLHVPETVTITRVLERDVAVFGTKEAVQYRYEQRYLPGQSLYRAEAVPSRHADIVLDNSNPAEPLVLRWLNKG